MSLPAAQAEAIKKAFVQADTGKDGKISRAEMRELLQKLCKITDVQFDLLFSSVDKNKDGQVSFSEFIDWVMDVQDNANDSWFVSTASDWWKGDVAVNLDNALLNYFKSSGCITDETINQSGFGVLKAAKGCVTGTLSAGGAVGTTVVGAIDGVFSPSKPSWSYRLYATMCDVRMLAKAAPHDVGKLRALTDAAGLPVSFAMVSGVKSKSVVFDGVHCHWMWPTGVDTPEICERHLLYIHGGAFCLGSPQTHSQTACVLAKNTNSAVLLPDYRRCPEYTVVDATEDCVKSYTKLLSYLAKSTTQVKAAATAAATAPASDAASIDDLEKAADPADIVIAARRVVVGGESAGAALSLALALKLRDLDLPLPAGLLLMSPWADLVDSIERKNASWNENKDFDFVIPELADLFARQILAAQYYGGIPDCDSTWRARIREMPTELLTEIASSPDVSPALAASFAYLPRTLVTIGGCETLRDSQLSLVEKLKEFKVDVDSEIFADMPHAVILANFLACKGCTAPMDVADCASNFIKECIPEFPQH